LFNSRPDPLEVDYYFADIVCFDF